MTSRLVFMHEALGYHFVDQWQSFGVGRFCCTAIASQYRNVNTLDIRAYHGALAGIMRTALFRLSCTFACLWTVSQECLVWGLILGRQICRRRVEMSTRRTHIG